jgi:hypothetical protein
MNPSGDLSDDTLGAAVSDQPTCELSSEAAVLHLPDGLFYGLNKTGAFFSERLQARVRVGNSPRTRDSGFGDAGKGGAA